MRSIIHSRRLEGLAAMRRCNHDQHRRLADLQATDPVVNSDPAGVPACARFPGDLLQYCLCHTGVRFIFQKCGFATAEMVAHHASECNNRTHIG
jgi:hypothetical protein